MALALRRASGLIARRAHAGPAPAQLSITAIARSGDHHGPEAWDPPFHRLPKPSRPLHEENELVWNDGVAPETALDFDAPHVSAATGLAWWLAGFGFFYGVWSFAKATGHPDNKPSASRALPESTITTALGDHGHGKF